MSVMPLFPPCVTVACPPSITGSLTHTLFSPDCHPLSPIGLFKISPGLMDSYISSWLSHVAYSVPWWWRQCTHLRCRSTFMRLHSTAPQRAVTFNSKKLWWIWFVSSHVANLLVTALQIRLYFAKLTKQVSHKCMGKCSARKFTEN
jgi:hypothetical protein